MMLNVTTNTSRSSCDLSHVEALMGSLRLVIYIPIFVFGLFLNTVALVVFCFLLKKWTECTIYMTNMVLMDLLLLFALPFRMYNFEWDADKRLACSFLESLYFISVYGSIYTITCVSVDRYIGVCHPFGGRQLRSKRKALTVCSVIWVLVWGATTPVYRLHNNREGKFNCFHGFSDEGWHPALIACLEVFGFLLPALVLVACSVKVVRTLQNSNQSSPTSRACICVIHSTLVAFLVPFTPSHLAILLQFLVRRGTITDCRMKGHISLFVQVAMSLANVTCCLDGLCYYFIFKEARISRDSIRRSLSRLRSTSASEAFESRALSPVPN